MLNFLNSNLTLACNCVVGIYKCVLYVLVCIPVQEKRNSDGSLGGQLALERKEVWNFNWANNDGH